MFGQRFPISDYYKGQIIDAVTVARTGSWWTAVLLIKDPKSEIPFLSLYRWQKHQDSWKVRSRFVFRRKRDVNEICKNLR